MSLNAPVLRNLEIFANSFDGGTAGTLLWYAGVRGDVRGTMGVSGVRGDSRGTRGVRGTRILIPELVPGHDGINAGVRGH